LHICFWGFTTAILKLRGHVIHRWKGVFQEISWGILKAPIFLNFQLVNQKNKFAVGYWLHIRVGKRLRFFLTMFSTSVRYWYVPSIHPQWSVVLQKSRTSTGCFSNLTGCFSNLTGSSVVITLNMIFSVWCNKFEHIH
jgi:hypothetical protein